MNENILNIRRRPEKMNQDYTRVIIKYHSQNKKRANHIVQRILELSEKRVNELIKEILKDFSGRHKNLEKMFIKHYNKVSDLATIKSKISNNRKYLIGSYFSHEYSIEAAAFFNPSIVIHPDQKGLLKGHVRIILSFRATGEGHVSSVEFRSGILDDENNILLDPISRYVEPPDVIENPLYDKHTFRLKLKEMGCNNELSAGIFSRLGNEFTLQQLKKVIKFTSGEVYFSHLVVERTIKNILWLAKSNYEVEFQKNVNVSERVLFPVTENEKNGIEDARFVRFIDNDGTITYYATFTAYNGYTILPQLIETKDFLKFKIITLNGDAVQNKGMALFPRKVNGKYMMISRQDGENMYIMTSDNVHFWQEAKLLRRPLATWEFVQIGNCGSPIETEKGWILLTHGVGPMREYSIGVDLLDLKDPSFIIASTKQPLLTPNDQEREGYVPNVVYTCGALIHNKELVIPYAMSDSTSGFALISLKNLFSVLLNQKK
ncbi:MAG: glycoside hydrolase family 130 protein [Spirochaetales bacterium]|nr:glycoside hydrolase family 130 protein [Spirochaetales bacterium]